MAERTRTGRISAINGALRRASLFGALAAIGAAAFAQTPPPVYQQGDRWTAWNPPTPPEGAEVYTIVSGDSLWSIASSQLGDPYLWPQIWELNSYIADAHWIYPGDPLVMPSATQAVADAAGDPLEDAAQVLADGGQLPVDDGSGDPLDSLLDGDGRRGGGWDPSFAGQGGKSAPVPLGFESDIYCSGYIGEIDESFPYAIAASEYEFLQPTLDPQRERAVKGLHGSTETEKVGLATGDIVYVEGGRADGRAAGEQQTHVDPPAAHDHP
ncbi:MAG: LysM peptidoglycan-binding domain-containing protein, partial [Acidobacteriota bacterium]